MAGKPRKRDYAAEYRRRQAKARREGFSGYYGKRIRRGAPPSAPAPTGAELRAARGHAAGSDLAREAQSDWFISVFPMDRDSAGRWTRIRIDAIDDEGREREYWLTGKQLTRKRIEQLAADLEAARVRFSPRYDLRKLDEPNEADEQSEAA